MSHRGVTLCIDPPSHHFLKDGLFQIDNKRLTGDNREAEYIYLRDVLNANDIDVHTADYLPTIEQGRDVLYVSMGDLRYYDAARRRPGTVLSGFFAMECPIVEPSLYRDLGRVHREFKRVFSWSDSASLERFVGRLVPVRDVRFPQVFDSVHEPIWSRTDRRFLVMINANKLPRLYWQELYTERMRAVAFYSRTGEIDLYGKGWDGPSNRLGKTWQPATLRRIERALQGQWQRWRPDPLLSGARRAYRGATPSKAETLGSYTFSLCFENMILKGWITEKIFDCFFSGTVPVYWGAPDIEDYIPADCFVDMRQFAGYAELRGYLKSLRGQDIQRYKENARDFLASPRFQPHTKQAFAEHFFRIVEEDAGISIDREAGRPPPAAAVAVRA
jgi:alpha(1,3/1,4) fucosyltransferase